MVIQFFTDVKIAPSDFPLTKLLQDLSLDQRKVAGIDQVSSNEVAYNLPQEHLSLRIRFHDSKKKTIDQVTYLNDNKMSKRDFTLIPNMRVSIMQLMDK